MTLFHAYGKREKGRSLPQISGQKGVWDDQQVMTKDIYHFLCRSFGERVAVAQVVDFDVPDVVSVCDVNITVDIARALARGMCGRLRSWARGLQSE